MLSRDCYIVKQNSRKRFLIPIYDISFPIFKAYTFLPSSQEDTLDHSGACVCVCVCAHMSVCVGAGDYNPSLNAWQQFILRDR